MNKFQKIAVQMAKDDLKKESVTKKNNSLKKLCRSYYHMFIDRPRWTYKRCLDFKKWNKKIVY